MDIHQIKDPAFDVNLYFLDGDPCTIVDTGTGLDVPGILRVAGRIRDPQDIEQIILTHRHIDHVGGADAISRGAGAVIRASRDEAEPLMAGDDATIGGSWFGRAVPPLEIEALEYDSTVEAGGGTWRILHTPGHTVGSICLFHEDSGSLISGDTVFTNGGVGRWDLPTGDFDDLLASIKFLERLSPDHLYPGHGPYAEGDALEHIQMALQFIDVAALQGAFS